jgi:hypothetical protein
MTFIPTSLFYQTIKFPAIFVLASVSFRLTELLSRLDNMPLQAGHCASQGKNRNCSGL